MASISRKPNSPFFMGKFRDETGRIVMRSTKQTGRKQAQMVVDAWEEAAVKARRGELTRATALKIVSALVERSTGELLVDSTAKSYFEEWLASRVLNGRATATQQRYSPVVSAFLKFLGSRAQKTIRGVTSLDIRRFRDGQLESGKSAVTANLAVSVLKACLERARLEGIIDVNPAAQVEPLQQAGETRLPFSDEQIRHLLSKANEDWTGMILLGAHAGLRLSDAANLTWSSVSCDLKSISFVPRKTMRSRTGGINIALHRDVAEWFKGRKEKLGEGGLLFPELAGRRTGSKIGLSEEFARIMTAAGINRVLGCTKKGKGRQTALLSFHSLRHSCVSRLANADINVDVRKTITGHSTDEAHARYTHLSLDTQMRSLAKVSSLIS